MTSINTIFNPPIPANPSDSLNWLNLYGASIGLAISRAIELANRPVVIIANDSLQASRLADELQFFSSHPESINNFPDWETLPYDHFSPHQDIISERLAVLSRISNLTHGATITTIPTLIHRVAPTDYLYKYSFLLNKGDHLQLGLLREKLTMAGYICVNQVREHGEYAIRGSLIDIFPMGSKTPYRIDLFDDEVDSIRTFSPDNQRSLETIDQINLLPAKEYPLNDEGIEHFRQHWRNEFSGNPIKCPIYQDISDGIPSPGIEYYLPLFFAKTASLFDYLPENTLIITVGDITARCNEFWHEIRTRYEQECHHVTRPILSPEKIFLSTTEILQALEKYSRINIKQNATTHKSQDIDFCTQPSPQLEINHKLQQPLEAVRSYVSETNGQVLFCVESIGRREVLLQLFNSVGLQPKFFSNWQEYGSSNAPLAMLVAPLEEGFILKQPPLTVITESQLYGKRVMQRRLRKKAIQDPDAVIRDLTELQIDDPIVHIDHGVGRYRGLETLTVGEQIAEFVSIEYQNNDKLYVPVASLHLIGRYTGTDPSLAPLNKLGTDHWKRTKRKAIEKIRDVAAELLDIYAQRAAQPGHNYQVPMDQYNTFAAAFPFEETPDQLNAIEQVFNDMQSDKPMDRVICGDVGFGKTEVAMRAAFIAAQNSKQTIVLVPTTLLAQQHFKNFQDRFADWPIQVEMLSRFRTAKETANVLNRLAEGKVDIVIGTHKLLQADIKLKSLGLVIIDEEHRFGVKQKEKLKSLRTTIDILTLTATPIPRTLNMSLSGIRDISIIATPPAKRLSVKTFVHESQENLIQEAIQREILRGGQVYFLHNDVATINKAAEDLVHLIPEARTIIAHGQMHERDLERTMSAFYHRQYNVLVCSTIIESGIDIPTANTIIINRADKFGLAQLHQLRGRVGRSHHQAYAYLLTPSRQNMTADAIKRLEAIAKLDDLGIGFTLATHDLEIRGAGELLGEEQSGEMHELGFSLYMDLLSRAVDALKNGVDIDIEKSLLTHSAEIDLHIPALIPETYVNDVQLRLIIYKRIASANSSAELDDIQIELIDRFGLLPDQLKNLIAVTELKLKANSLGIQKIEANEAGGKLEFNAKTTVDPTVIIKLIQTQSQRFKLDGPTRLKFTLEKHEITQRIELVSKVLSEL